MADDWEDILKKGIKAEDIHKMMEQMEKAAEVSDAYIWSVPANTHLVTIVKNTLLSLAAELPYLRYLSAINDLRHNCTDKHGATEESFLMSAKEKADAEQQWLVSLAEALGGGGLPLKIEDRPMPNHEDRLSSFVQPGVLTVELLEGSSKIDECSCSLTSLPQTLTATITHGLITDVLAEDADTELEEDAEEQPPQYCGDDPNTIKGFDYNSCPQGHHTLDGECRYWFCSCRCNRCRKQCDEGGH